MGQIFLRKAEFAFFGAGLLRSSFHQIGQSTRGLEAGDESTSANPVLPFFLRDTLPDG
jgi:hypothetical protein